MTERQQTGLPHQHVERQGEDDHHAHLAEHGHHEARVTPMLPVVKQPGQHYGNQQRGNPRPKPDSQRYGTARRQRPYGGIAHVSRVPISPRGRNSRIRISNAYGTSGPMRETGMVRISPSRSFAWKVMPNGLARSANDQSATTENVCTMPIRIEAMKQPASDPRPPKITTTNTIGPIASAMPDSVVK